MALWTFARRYADQTEADHAAMVAAIGRFLRQIHHNRPVAKAGAAI